MAEFCWKNREIYRFVSTGLSNNITQIIMVELQRNIEFEFLILEFFVSCIIEVPLKILKIIHTQILF